MYIIIDEKKIKAGADILNGEKIIIKIKNIDSNENYISVASFASVSDPGLTKSMVILGFSDRIPINPDSSIGSYEAAKLVVQKLKSIYPELTDNDYKIKSELVWREELRTIRLYIPQTRVIENQAYNVLVPQLIEIVPFFKNLNGYILYLEEIYPDMLTILANDQTVLIENFT